MQKVLIADKDVLLAQSSCDFLLQNNFSIDTSFSGIDTVNKYLTTNPNILVLDNSFTDLNTSKIIDIISCSKNEQQNRNVIITINPDEPFDVCNTTKIYSFVKKPYQKNVLLHTLKTFKSYNNLYISKDFSDITKETFIYNIFLNMGMKLTLEGNNYLFEIVKYYFSNQFSNKKLEDFYLEFGKNNNLSSEAIRTSIRTSLKSIDISKNNKYIDFFEKNREITPKYFINVIFRIINSELNKK